MSDIELLNGVHYMVDYYAFLGIERTVDAEAVKRACKAKLALYHPDKYESLAPDLKRQAEGITKVIVEAKNVLEDYETRYAYDVALVEFKGPISTSGFPVYSPSFYNSVERVQMDEEVLKALMETQVKQMSGYDPKKVKFFEKLVSKDPSPENKKMLDEAYADYDVYMSIEESFRREVLGIKEKQPDFIRFGYIGFVAEELREVKKGILDVSKKYLTAARSGEIKLLSSEVGVNPFALATLDQSEIQALIKQEQKLFMADFYKSASKLKAVVTKRETLLKKRLDNLEVIYKPKQVKYFPKLVICLKNSKGEFWLAIQFVDGKFVNDETFSKEQMKKLKNISYAKHAISMGYNIVYADYLDGIEVMEILSEIGSRHMQKYFEQEGITLQS